MNKLIAKLLLGVLFVLGTSNAFAQPSNYGFAGSTGTYAAIAGTSLTFSSQDDASTGNLPIGFTFNYNGINQTVFAASTNGLLIMGQTTNAAGLSANALASTANIIAGLWDDNNVTGASVQYVTTGSAPNRVLTVQYTGLHVGGGGSPTNPTIDMQILLYETTSIIQFVYGATSAAFTSTSASIGISGNSGNFLSVTPTSPTVPPYATTNNVTENTSISSATNFPSGMTYTFTPPAPCVPPTSLAASVNLTPGVASVAGSFTAAPPTVPTGYMVVRTSTNAQPLPVSGTTYTVGTNAIGYIEYVNTAAGSWTSTGLSATTTYYYWVFSYNSGCSGAPSYSTNATTSSTTTTACSLSGIKSVGPAGDYPTLKAAVDAVVLNGLTGPLTLELNAAYGADDAVFPIVLGNVPCASAINTITIRPAAGAGAKTISGSNTTAIFDINGGNYWRIDGRQGGTGSNKDLTISNTSTTTGGVAIRYINEASNNIVNYSVLKGLFASTTSGVVLFSTTTGANGNDNNTIDNCDIDGGAAVSASPTLVATNGIYAAGTTTTLATYNNNITISNNNVFNFFNAGTSCAGILVSGGNSDWTIQNNKIYQTSARVFTTTALTYFGISQTNSGMVNMLVSGNIIGFATNTGTGVTNISGSSNMVRGIRIFPGTTTVSTVQNNVVTAITQSTSRASTTVANGAFYGIAVNTSGLVNITGNTIGSLDNATSISITQTSTTSGTVASAGIYDEATALQNITNNNVGSITVTQTATQYGGLRGIQVNLTTGIVANITGNTIGGPSIASGLTLTGGLSQLIGIHALIGVNNISNNTVQFLTNQGSANTGTGTSAQLIGISQNSADAGQTISLNTIRNLSNSAIAAVNTQAAGLFINSATTGTNNVFRNYIHTITTGSTGTATLHYGINIAGGAFNFYNNIVAIGNGMTNNIGIFGINDGIGTNNYYYNSVYIGGSASGNLNTFAFNSGVTLNTRRFQNNIFFNARTNSSTGRGYAVSVSGSAPNPTGLTIGNNDYWVAGTGTVLGRFNSADVLTLAAWQAAVGQDAQSLNVDPLYIAPTAAAPNLHITSGTTTLESAALAISGITNDFDNDPRPGAPSGTNSGVGPDIGADEFDGINPSLCTGTPAAGGTASASTLVSCSGSNVTFTLTGATGGPGISYQWQRSPAGSNAWVDVAGATAAVSTFAITGNTDVRCLVKCVPSGLNTPSTTVTVNGVNCQFNIVKSAATFTSISGTGASMTGTWRNGNTNNDDNLSASQPIGFTFAYKGVNYTNFSVSTNGYLTFNVGTAATGGGLGAYGYSNSNLSTSAGTVTALAPFYEDLVTPGNPTTLAGLNAAMKYQVDGSAPNRVLTVEWIGMETFSNAGPNLNFQVKIYETTGVVEYVYGTMEGFNGTATYTYTYTVGLNGPVVSGTPTVTELQTQQVENVQNFSALPANSLTRVPDCNIKYTFTPNTYGSADPSPGAPANDEAANAITVSVNASPCTSLCGTYFTSKNATPSAGITACSAGTPGTPDDDVWFKFIASASAQNISLRGAGDYDAVLQLFSNAGTTSVTCVNAASTGLTETINATGLTAGNTYYVRVYHSGAGSGTTGDFSICVNEITVPPSNDDPCGAFALTVGATCAPYSDNSTDRKTAFLTATTTTSNGVTAPSCSGAGATVNDVWFTFIAPANGSANIDVTPVAGVNPAIELYSAAGICPGGLVLTSLGCINGAGTGGAEQAVANGLTGGNTYYVRIYQHPSGTGGAPVSNSQFSICIYTPQPVCPTTFTPANAATVCASASSTTLSWTVGTFATGYDVYFDAGAGPAVTLVSPNQAGLTYNVGILAPGTYAWRIEPKNIHGTTVCSNLTFTVVGTSTWIGTTPNANLGSNWSCGTVPTSIIDIIIPTSPSGGNMPVQTGSLSVRAINLQPSATFGLGGQTLTINGAVTGSGTFTGSPTSNLTVAGAATTLNFTTGSGSLNNLSLGATGSATLGTALDIYGVLGFTAGGNLDMNTQAVTLKSTATATARVANLTGSTLTGASNVTVERYVPNPQRAWHLLSAKAVTGSQNIFDSWQEGGLVVSQKGTWMTSGAVLLPGFDATSGNGSSILIHDQTGPSWTTIPVATTTGTALSSRQGYMVFVRGDRTCTAANATVTPTVLKANGLLTQGLVNVTVSTGTGKTLVGNPYASPIDMEGILAPGGTPVTNLDMNYLVWDPALAGSFGVGGYRAVVRTGANAYDQTPVVLGGTVTNDPTIQFIHSGSAFFLHATTASVTLPFNEVNKTASTTTVYNPIVATVADQQIIANLMTVQAGNVALADGIRVYYNDKFNATTTDDIIKMGNFTENISSWRDGQKMIVERRPMIKANDTIFLRMTGTTIRDYRFQIGTIDFVQTDVTAYLEDTYKGSRKEIDLSGTINYIDFNVTSDAASSNQDRFRIVFAAKGPQPQTITTIKAVKTTSPGVQGDAVSVEWKAANQYDMKQYELERSTDGVNYSKVNTQAAKGANGSDVLYNWLDVNPVMGNNFYRLRSIGNSGDVTTSQAVLVTISKGNPAITVYPNPVNNHTVSLRFTAMEKGSYQVRIFSTVGQLVFTKTVNHAGGNGMQTLVFDAGMAKGNYRMEIVKPDNTKTTKSIVITE